MTAANSTPAATLDALTQPADLLLEEAAACATLLACYGRTHDNETVNRASGAVVRLIRQAQRQINDLGVQGRQ